MQLFSQESIDFQKRISQRNGLGDDTSIPMHMHAVPPVINHNTSRAEAEMVLFGAVGEALQKTGEGPWWAWELQQWTDPAARLLGKHLLGALWLTSSHCG